MAVAHIAGPPVTIDGRYLRQRCGWCGETLIDCDLTMVAVPVGQDPTPATWPAGALVTVDGHAAWTVEGAELPGDACARNPLTLTSFATRED